MYWNEAQDARRAWTLDWVTDACEEALDPGLQEILPQRGTLLSPTIYKGRFEEWKHPISMIAVDTAASTIVSFGRKKGALSKRAQTETIYGWQIQKYGQTDFSGLSITTLVHADLGRIEFYWGTPREAATFLSLLVKRH
jgi:hypothetical protein